MKIESRNKKKMYHDFILRSGNGSKRAMTTVRPQALAIMRAKPYGGIYEQKLDTQGQC